MSFFHSRSQQGGVFVVTLPAHIKNITNNRDEANEPVDEGIICHSHECPLTRAQPLRVENDISRYA